MSKGLGSKIAIKFTEDINELQMSYPIYKYFRWQIDSRWSSYIYLYGIELKTDGDYFLPIGAVTTSNQYSTTYSADKAFDGSISTYWQTRVVPAWVQIELADPITLTGFRWNTQTSTYRPRGFSLLASNDGENWVEVYAAESPAVSYWKEFNWLPLLQSGNERAFKILGQEYQYINGPLIDKEYQIKLIENHPTEDKALLVTMENIQGRFPTVEGSLTVEYDASIGNLTGQGGAVESFVATFTPTDLVPEPNPGIIETLTGAPELNVAFLEVAYINGYVPTETIAGAVGEVTVLFQAAEIINP